VSEHDLYLPEASAEGRLSSAGPAVRVEGLSKSFGSQKVLKDVNFELERGKVYSILGPSGCGKSTLLKSMIGAHEPDTGNVEIDGIPVWGEGERNRAKARRKFGVLFQSGALLNGLTCGENVALPLKRHTNLPDSTIDMMVRMKLELVGMGHAIDKRPPELSGGMIKRCALARAIALDPAIVFYDEPSAGIDPVMIAVLDRLILDLSDKLGITSVVITHEIPSALRISDEMIMLWNGQVHFRGTTQDFRQNDDPVVSQFMHGYEEGPLSEGRSKAALAAKILGIDEKELFNSGSDVAQRRAAMRFEEERERRARTASERYREASNTMFTTADEARKRHSLRTERVSEDHADSANESASTERQSEFQQTQREADSHSKYTDAVELDYLRQLEAAEQKAEAERKRIDTELRLRAEMAESEDEDPINLLHAHRPDDGIDHSEDASELPDASVHDEQHSPLDTDDNLHAHHEALPEPAPAPRNNESSKPASMFRDPAPAKHAPGSSDLPSIPSDPFSAWLDQEGQMNDTRPDDESLADELDALDGVARKSNDED